MSLILPTVITAGHNSSNFDCGKDSLNQYLKRFALPNSASGVARTYVTTRPEEQGVLGYYSLAAGSVEKAFVPERVSKGTPSHPIPVVLVARLAVDRSAQGQGIGKELLRDALSRVVAAADIIGVRAVLVHAKDTEARTFYEKWGFVRSPTNELHLMLLMKDLRRTLDGG